MRKLIIVTILLIGMFAYSQTYISPIVVPTEISNDYFPNATRIILTNIAAVSLDAIGDGLMDSGQKEWGHAVNAASVGVLISIPLCQGFTFKEWCWYAASYTFTRIAIFDPVYNMTRGLPLNYHGTTSTWDKTLGGMNAGGLETFARSIFFTASISIPIQQFGIKNRRAKRKRYEQYNSTLIVY